MFARMFAVSWIAYFGFYLCRKNFSVLMPYFKSETGMSSGELANALFAYSLMYSLGQFAMGRLVDRVGGRWVAGAGMLISALVSSLMAWPAWLGVAGVLMGIQAVNGAAQSTGWPSVLKLTTEWFPVLGRGKWMGWWSTHMVLGGFAGTWLAVRSAEVEWTRAAWVPSLIVVTLAFVFMTLARDGVSVAKRSAAQPGLQMSTPLLVIAAMYFCVKLTRYAFLFWLPLYMTEHLHYAKPLAGYASSMYELVGVFGALGAGYLSERFGGARFSIGTLMMGGLALLCVSYPTASTMGLTMNLAWIGLIGAFTFGPDTLMAGAALQDVVPRECIGAAGGFVNGVGSVGQILSPLLVAQMSSRFGWEVLFAMLGLIVLAGSVLLGTQWILAPKHKQEIVL